MADLEADEDALLTAPAQSDPNVANPDSEQDTIEDEPIQDFRFLALRPGQKIPSRGTKDFEPHGTQLQSSILEDSRTAMHNVLAEERFHVPGGQRVVYDPIDHGAWVVKDGGKWASSVGRSRKVPNLFVDEKPVNRLWLLPEEVLWLVDRGSIDLRWPAEKGEAEDQGLPMSLQGAYAMFIGKEETGLSLEQFNVYQNLKRAGYSVFRAEDNRHNIPVCDDEVQSDNKTVLQSLWSIWENTFAESEKSMRQRQAVGPLVQPGLYRDYKSIYKKLALIPYHNPMTTPALVRPQAGDPAVTYHVYKSSPGFRKTAPGPPDFYICVVPARNTLMYTEADFEALLRQTPFQPKKGTNMYQKLRLGARKVILAVVDQGVTSYINVADAGFGNEKLFERSTRAPRGGKRGGGRGRGRGRGRGGRG